MANPFSRSSPLLSSPLFSSPLLSSLGVIRPCSPPSSGLIIQSNRCPSSDFRPSVTPTSTPTWLILPHLHLLTWCLHILRTNKVIVHPHVWSFFYPTFYCTILFILLLHFPATCPSIIFLFLSSSLSFLSPSLLFFSLPYPSFLPSSAWCQPHRPAVM